MAQFGSALDWGSRGRRFKSCQPDQLIRAGQKVKLLACFFVSIRHGSGLGITLVANWRCFRRKFQYRFRHQLRHEPQFRSLFDSRAKYGIGFDVDSSFGFECGVGLCINLEISLIPNFDIGLSVGFDSETRFDGKLCLIFSTLFLSLRDCTNGDIWVSLNLRKKSEEEFLCVMAYDSVDSVRKRDKGASLQRFLCCVPGIVERGASFPSRNSAALLF